MTSRLAGCEIGLVKLAEAAIAIAITTAYGEIPSSVAARTPIGAISTISAAVGTTIVANAVST